MGRYTKRRKSYYRNRKSKKRKSRKRKSRKRKSRRNKKRKYRIFGEDMVTFMTYSRRDNITLRKEDSVEKMLDILYRMQVGDDLIFVVDGKSLISYNLNMKDTLRTAFNNSNLVYFYPRYGRESKMSRREREIRKIRALNVPEEDRYVLSVRKNPGELYGIEGAPTGVVKVSKKGGKLKYVDSPGGSFYPRREGSVEGSEKYGESYLLNVKDEVTYIINAHGSVDPSGISINIPPNIKVFSPLTCLGELSIFKSGDAYTQFESACPSSKDFSNNYVLTYYEKIPEVSVYPETYEGQFGKTWLGIKTGAGVFKCTGTRSIYDPLPIISIDKKMKLSEIIKQLHSINEGTNINIILLTCLGFPKTSKLSSKDLGENEKPLDEYTLESIKTKKIKDWNDLQRLIINDLFIDLPKIIHKARLIPKTKMVISYLSTGRPLFHIIFNELPDVSNNDSKFPPLSPEEFMNIEKTKENFIKLSEDFKNKFENTEPFSTTLSNHKKFFQKFANKNDEVRSILYLIRKSLLKIL